MINSELLSKRNMLIGSGVLVCLVGIGVVIYTNKQKTLYQQVWDKASGSSSDVAAGVNGDWTDVYALDSWNPSYLNQSDVSPTTLDYATSRAYAQSLYDAHTKGLLNKQADVVAVFNKLQNQSDLAKVAQQFSAMKFGYTLKDYLKSFMEGGVLSHNYMQDIYGIISKLPK